MDFDLEEYDYFRPEVFRYQGPGLGNLPELETTSVCDLAGQIRRAHGLDPQRNVASRADLLSYAHLFQIPTEGRSDDELIEEIQRLAPCQWIARVKEWALENPESAKFLNRYVTDDYMEILRRRREGEPLNEEEQYLEDLNHTIHDSPKPDRGFTAYRGWYGPPGKVGDIVELDVPKSGSFALDPIFSAYLDFSGEDGIACCLMEVYIPSGATLTYHPSEDQIIFPAGAQFHIMSGPSIAEYPVFGEIQKVKMYQAVYIGANESL